MTNQTKVNTTDKVDILNTIYFYTEYVVLMIGIVFNLISMTIFIRIVKNEQQSRSHLYKYFIIKSFADFAILVVNLPEMFYFPNSSKISSNYSMQVWYIYFYYYLFNVCSCVSAYCELAASFDCFMLIYGKYGFFKLKKFFISLVTCLIVYSAIFNYPITFLFRIISLNDDSGGYQIEDLIFKNNFHKIYRLVYYSNRDIIPLAGLFILNGLILINIKKLTTRRLAMNSTNELLTRKARRAENNKMKMILFTSITYIFHFPAIIFYSKVLEVKLSVFSSRILTFIFLLPYTINILSYILFNTTFRRYMYEIISLKFFRLRN
jgi:hypothetical protein